ncbi:MAG: cupin domain-containing protein [Anaerolineae bacterium]
MTTAEALIEALDLRPHPEGGYFAETYRAAGEIPAEALPARYAGSRAYSTAIYYLLTPDSCSRLHRLASDEVFHFYLGDAVEMWWLFPDGSERRLTLGHDVLAGMHPQVVVPKDVWQGARLKRGGRFALLGCTVAPGFDYVDFELADRETLLSSYPQHRAQILTLT